MGIAGISLLSVALLAAKPAEEPDRIKTGDKTLFRGHTFSWTPESRDTDIVEDPVIGEMVNVIMVGLPRIDAMDDDKVYRNNDETLQPAGFGGKDADAFYAYVAAQFNARFGQLPDDLHNIYIDNLVIDERGKVRYYEIKCNTGQNTYDISQGDSPYQHYAVAISSIIDSSPGWQPAALRRRLVKSGLEGFYVFNRSTHAKP